MENKTVYCKECEFLKYEDLNNLRNYSEKGKCTNNMVALADTWLEENAERLDPCQINIDNDCQGFKQCQK
ncbi:MAG: hypothetical protein ACXAC7_23055 [Candidatus Hodarchaeales archaeon]|jgi:hypothetical protein